MTINAVIEKYDGRDLRLKTRILEVDEDSIHPYVLIEGSADTLRKLAELILALPDDNIARDFQMGPNAPGCAHFTKDSTIGIYINCVD
ncbi:hypothetical protein [Pseudochrobactrum sp. B5]|uniref:hypothetical protein n=1 Tax=Pseudochrobactrum sp. B5 TaxID=1289478 RepID=UPI00095299B9|nr:hypothetical protein [Pseudochrobactrum sp. B5]